MCSTTASRWTEEIAIYCLVAVVFLGSAMCVRLNRHIHVDFLYRYLSPGAGRALSTLVDLVRTAFFAYLALLVWRYASIISDERMTTIDFPKGPLFMLVFAAFVLMALRSAQVAVANWRRGYSVLATARGVRRAGRDDGRSAVMIVLLGGFLLLMVFGVPVAVAMAVASLAYLLVHGGAPDVIVAQRMIAGVESFPLLAVPFFILAGNLMNIAGVTGRIYAFAVALVGWMRGGLAQVNIIGSVIFSGMSGTAVADAAGIGTIEIKAMKDHGYPLDVAVGVTAASATLGPIIPPSLPFVIYGMMANVSIGALFLGGVLPGVLMTLFMMITVAILARMRGWGSDAPFQLRQIGAALVEILVVSMYPGRRVRVDILRLQPRTPRSSSRSAPSWR